MKSQFVALRHAEAKAAGGGLQSSFCSCNGSLAAWFQFGSDQLWGNPVMLLLSSSGLGYLQ